MNRQRELIYRQRDQVLNGEELKPIIMKMILGSINEAVDGFCTGAKDDWNIEGLREKFRGWLMTDSDFADEVPDKEEIRDILSERAETRYNEREEMFGTDENGTPLMRELERQILLRNVDTQWMDHIDAMDQLRRGIGLRAYGQTDPVVAYREVGSDMFDCMNDEIRESTARMILTVIIKNENETKREQTVTITSTSGSSDGTEKKRPVRNAEKKIGPNDPCPCGSGKKYKKCCGSVNKVQE